MDSLSLDTLIVWIARVLVLFTMVPVHESAHGRMAYRLGDDTAYRQGRLTLNPFRHMDLLGGLLLIFTGFGWAKPVPVDPGKFKNPRRDMALTALAGPLANILLALLGVVIYKLLDGLVLKLIYNSADGGLSGIGFIRAAAIAVLLLQIMVKINLRLAVFNLLPVPPLDGSRIFGVFLPDRYYFSVMRYERYLSFAVLALLMFTPLSDFLTYLSNLLLGGLDWITTPIGWLF